MNGTDIGKWESVKEKANNLGVKLVIIGNKFGMYTTNKLDAPDYMADTVEDIASFLKGYAAGLEKAEEDK